ncbi:MAG: hypothetical protein ACI4EG_15215 [Fusicatenibacter sp.]
MVDVCVPETEIVPYEHLLELEVQRFRKNNADKYQDTQNSGKTNAIPFRILENF